MCIVLFCVALSGYGQESVPAIGSAIDAFFQEKRPVGLAVGVVRNGEIRFTARGETIKGNQQLPDENTVFEAGYLTQLYTTSLLALLDKKQMALLDDQLQHYLPDSVVVPTYQDVLCGIDQFTENIEDDPIPIFVRTICVPDPNAKVVCISLCNLASHSSGLPGYPRKVKKRSHDPFASYTLEDLYRYVPRYKLYSPPGQEFEYSVLGITLLGQAMVNKTELDYETLVITELLQPLDMNDTRITLNYDQRARLAQGHKKRNKPVEPWKYQVMAPVGAFKSTTTDMAKFMKANLGLVNRDICKALKTTHQPRVIADLPNMPHSKIGMGWKISGLDQSSHEMRWFDSVSRGSSGFIGFVKETKTGVVILCNSDISVKPLGITLLNVLHMPPNSPDTTAR